MGFKISLAVVDAKAKLGQHRSNADQQRVAAGRGNSTSAEHQALLNCMNELYE